MTNTSPQRPYLIIGVLVALVTIFIFATGIVDLPSLFSPEKALQRKMIGT